MPWSAMSDPQSSPTLNSAVALHQSGKLEAAARAYRRILEQRPEEPHALHLLGVVHVQRAEPDEGATLIEQAISLQPNVGTYHLNLAWAYRAMRRVDDAIAEAEKAIALDSAGCGAGGYHVAGLAFADAGQFDDAIYCFEKSLAAMSSAPAGARRDNR